MTATVRTGDMVGFVPAWCSLRRGAKRDVRRFARSSGADFVYGDSLHTTDDRYEEPFQVLRPDWSPERLRGHNYVGDVVFARHDVVDAAGGVALLASLDAHDRALRLAEHAMRPRRITSFLYDASWEHSVPTANLAAVEAHCTRVGIAATCVADSDRAVQVRRTATAAPRVAVIVPTRGTRAEVWGRERVLAAGAITAMRNTSTYANLEYIVVLDHDTPADARREIEAAGGSDVSVVEFDRPFNFAEKVNLAAVQTDAEFLLLLNDDTEIVSPDIVETMLSYFNDPGVGLVGPMLLYDDGSIQSAGHFFNPVPYDYYRGHPVDTPGASNMLRVAREVSSVIAACAITPRALFEQVGGLCTKFPGNYNDIDYALKLRMAGKRTVWTPLAACHHFESKTREPVMKPADVAELGARWRDMLENDPYAHPALQRYQPVWKSNRPGQRSVDEAVGPTAPMASK
ncbi:MAG: glycosyltransferase [Ilumatobacteraceae bacterium]|nr:glycosyltransferase [Ilumatobacteraceae bacterium]